MIEPAVAEDIPVIREVALHTWPVAYANILGKAQLEYMLDMMYSEKALLEQITLHGHRFLLAQDLDDTLGFASFSSHLDKPDTTRLHKLYVLPGLQGQGIGLALLTAAVQAARVAGHSHLELNVNRFNMALEFYKRQGFRVVRSEQINIGQGFIMDDHVLELDLSTRP